MSLPLMARKHPHLEWAYWRVLLFASILAVVKVGDLLDDASGLAKFALIVAHAVSLVFFAEVYWRVYRRVRSWRL